ncbi:unnamed protein product [Arctia plantaginis]|uniref:Uncharacterized protein n=1 Tax=Arctia plantaginis TaxID=874455 RepID=A0A8S0Z7V2_ARCPL|nr:unnamed protein product [Arctia plantaginis]
MSVVPLDDKRLPALENIKALVVLRRIELSPTNSRATLYLGTRDGNEPTCAGGHQCCRLHAVGPRAHTRHAYVRVQDYYAPEHNDTQLYTIPEDCPPRISHDLPQYTSSDNLFSKAKHLKVMRSSYE